MLDNRRIRERKINRKQSLKEADTDTYTPELSRGPTHSARYCRWTRRSTLGFEKPVIFSALYNSSRLRFQVSYTGYRARDDSSDYSMYVQPVHGDDLAVCVRTPCDCACVTCEGV